MSPEPGTPRWWARSLVHNMVVHPWLPLADAMDRHGPPLARAFARLVYEAHDRTAPKGAG